MPIANFGSHDFSSKPLDFGQFNFGSRVNFSNARFGDSAHFGAAHFDSFANFSGSTFGNGANFAGTHFGDVAAFDGARFGHSATFQGAQFGRLASFARASFGTSANFQFTNFSDESNFRHAQLGASATFTGAEFGARAMFRLAQFGDRSSLACVLFADSPSFMGAKFGSSADFECAVFGRFTSFRATRFGNSAGFGGVHLGDWTRFDCANFEGLVIFEGWTEQRTNSRWEACFYGDTPIRRRTDSTKRLGVQANTFLNISFAGVQFRKNVSFQNRQFLGETNFGPFRSGTSLEVDSEVPLISQPTRFQGLPEFHGCSLFQNTSFDEADFDAPLSLAAARAYRTLKLAMAQHQSTRDEQRFFRLEMRAEGASSHSGQAFLIGTYGVLADYGFSLVRPIFFWIATTAVFGLVFWLLASSFDPNWTISWRRVAKGAEYMALNAIPVPGFDKWQSNLREQVFGQTGWRVYAVVSAEILQKVSSFLFIFLIGLALRNFFKLKG